MYHVSHTDISMAFFRYHVDTEVQGMVHMVLTSVGAITGAVRPPAALVAEVEKALRQRNLFNGKLAELIGKLKRAAPSSLTANGVAADSQSHPLPASRRLSRQLSEAKAPPSTVSSPSEVSEQLTASILASLRYGASTCSSKGLKG